MKRYYPDIFPCIVYRDDNWEGVKFMTAAEFEAVDDGKWGTLAMAKAGIGGAADSETAGDPLDGLTKKQIVEMYGLDVPDIRKVSRADVIAMIPAEKDGE